ncbi:hypothetical protein COCSADRAFT_293147 [Bipolaris sorokiniana ND90Pr]|uniref:Uncharacterized protein n=1 Tax=Cochliobolus sativus (strain ND90Pr / ATCC 201652) TaxID=665912 RepID=M2SZN3_COCSN|nr:uncharacterized protein COCSADRAFT_293147 [Bipolaris sorokiniana ND90Pr]EMD67775.1 hypothetical protein COCSADRAFT_293147 [Bipolaris sorokiniana ND90Pr]
MFLHGRCDLGPALFVSVERKRKCLAKKTLHCTHTPSWIKNGNEDVSTCLGLCKHGERCFRPDFVAGIYSSEGKALPYVQVHTHEGTHATCGSRRRFLSSDGFRTPRSNREECLSKRRAENKGGWRQGSRSGLSRASCVAVVPCSLAPGEKGEPCGVASHVC